MQTEKKGGLCVHARHIVHVNCFLVIKSILSMISEHTLKDCSNHGVEVIIFEEK